MPQLINIHKDKQSGIETMTDDWFYYWLWIVFGLYVIFLLSFLLMVYIYLVHFSGAHGNNIMSFVSYEEVPTL